jgi:TonB family protein
MSGQDYSRRTGTTVVEFTIARDGKITETNVVDSSGQKDLDGLALGSIALSHGALPLPKAYAKDEMRMTFSFKLLASKVPVRRKRDVRVRPIRVPKEEKEPAPDDSHEGDPSE